MAYLKHKDTGEVFPTNENLIKRGDMIPCNLDGSLIDASEAPVEKPKAVRKPRVKKEVEETEVPDVDLSDIDVDYEG